MIVSEKEISDTFSFFLKNGNLSDASKKISDQIRDLFYLEKNEITYANINLIVETLEPLGFFDLRNAVKCLSTSLCCSRKTIYNYLHKEKEYENV
jgi:predicted transcriptional regulator YheO